MGFASFFDNFIQIAILLIAWLIVVISFFVMAIQLFVSLIEFKTTSWPDSSWFRLESLSAPPSSLRRCSAIWSHQGVKILVLAVIIGIGSTIFGQFTGGFNNPPTIDDASL